MDTRCAIYKASQGSITAIDAIDEKEELLREMGLHGAVARYKKGKALISKYKIAESLGYKEVPNANSFWRTTTTDYGDRVWTKIFIPSWFKRLSLWIYPKRAVYRPIKECAEEMTLGAICKLKEARDLGIFDDFSVVKLESVVRVKDPALVGVIRDGDRPRTYLICLWG